METHPYGWLSLAPPVVAVITAIVTRRIVPALLLGIAVGALITSQGNLPRAIIDLFEVHLWSTLIQPDKLRVSAFTLLIGATIGVIQASGAMRSMVESLSKFAKTRQTGQIGAWTMGLIVFFDDYANCLLLGTTLAPICDRLKISREKLAYIVDSTAAPVAGLALVSTWIAVELDYIREGLSNLTAAESAGLGAFELFVACIPYRFYVIQTLLLVFLVGWLGRDVGPMLRAERQALRRKEVPPTPENDHEQKEGARQNAPWWCAAIPIAVTLLIVLGLIYLTGRNKMLLVAGDKPILLRDIFGSGDSSLALMYGGLIGLATAIVLCSGFHYLKGPRLMAAMKNGANLVLPALVILWLASTMSRLTSNKAWDGRAATEAVAFEFKDHRLYTGEYMKGKLIEWNNRDDGRGAITHWLPTIIFVLAGVISFCTGTSYGTMGILTPMVIPLAFASIDPAGGAIAQSPILLGCLGSVLAGAIFGDHCSPISDTTILSSQASGCDHLAHVKTQMPYAMIAAGVSIFLGTIGIGFGFSVWLLLPLQTACMIAILFVFGRRPEENNVGT
jgi:Na+/H+ antiporter NhaC